MWFVLVELVLVGEMLVREVGVIGSADAFECFDICEAVPDHSRPDPGDFEAPALVSLERGV